MGWMVTARGLWWTALCPDEDWWQAASPGVHLGTGIVQHLYQWLSGIECALSKCVDDTKLCGAVNTMEGWAPSRWIQTCLKEWAHMNRTKLSKAKYWTCVTVIPDICTDWKQNSLRAALQRRTLGSQWKKAVHEPALYFWGPDGQLYPGLHQQRWQQGEERDCPPLLCLREAPSAALHPSLGPQHRKTVELLEWVQRRATAQSEGWSTWLIKKGWEKLGLFSKKAPGLSHCNLPLLEGSL